MNTNQHPSNQQNPQANRLHLNFNFQGQTGFSGAEQGRAFPTTPSTFPQPLSTGPGQQEVWGTNPQPNAGFTQSGYFMNPPYNSQAQQQQQGQQHNGQSQAYRGAPLSPSGYQDPTNGLAQQLQHQTLGNAARAGSPYARQPSPASRPGPAGRSPSQPQYGQFLGSAMPHKEQPSICDDEIPAKSPQKYSSTVANRAKLQSELVGTFFKDSVERARERNGRSASCFQSWS